MTTKLQHSINPLTRAPHTNYLAVLITHQESEVGLHRLLSSMDRPILESNQIESMRKMMLMQEQLFKQQVQELHRLYNLQKKLMHEIGNGLTRKQETTATETGQSFKAFTARDDPKEVSGSNSGESSRIPIKFDLEMPAESTTPTSIHPFEEQKGLKNMDEETDVEVELTLSIGHCTSKRRSKSHLHHCSTELTQLQYSKSSNQVQELGSSSTKTDKGDQEYGEPSSMISSSSVCQENTRPHWLLQDLSLNRT